METEKHRIRVPQASVERGERGAEGESEKTKEKMVQKQNCPLVLMISSPALEKAGFIGGKSLKTLDAFL